VKDYVDLLKALMDLGTTALLIVTAAWLANKWAPKFLEAQQGQARAMTELASAVKEGQSDQQETLVAVRVLAQKVDEVKGWMRDLDDHIVRGLKT
jgi:hypothetical protein